MTRLFFHDYGGHGFTAELARALAGRGHEVTYASFGAFDTPKGRVEGTDADPEDFRAITLDIGEPFDKDNLIRRQYQQIAYARVAAEAVVAERPHVVVSSNSPLEVQDHLQRACRATDAGFVFWLQDVHSVAISRILGRKSRLLGRLAGAYYQRLERRLIEDSDAVVAISQDFLGLLGARGWGIDTSHVSVIENWAPLELLRPVARDNDWSRANFRPGRRRIVYTGTLARKHNPEMLVELARQVDADVHLFSQGRGPEQVRARAAELGLDNLFVRPWVSVEDLPKVLAGADLLCAFVEKDAGAFSVPSKVLSYLAAGRPIIAAIPETNLASRTILRAGAGLVSGPGDGDAMAANARRLLADPALCERLGRAGRRYAEATFDIAAISSRFEAVLSDASHGNGKDSPPSPRQRREADPNRVTRASGGRT
jgi:glycosyltransferase involved in cell wall biosynthesis